MRPVISIIGPSSIMVDTLNVNAWRGRLVCHSHSTVPKLVLPPYGRPNDTHVLCYGKASYLSCL